ncbi:MAG: hypothetical protein IJU66_06985 [Oscillospiraceae bacterium]|nr:hypothetical protein [Oscillospiraceae bacterium]
MKSAKRIALGTAAALAAYLALLALASALAVQGSIKESSFKIIVWASACLASLLGFVTAAPHGKENVAPRVECAAAFWLSIALLGFLINENVSASRLCMLLIPIGIGFAAANLFFAGGGKRSKGKRRYKK